MILKHSTNVHWGGVFTTEQAHVRTEENKLLV